MSGMVSVCLFTEPATRLTNRQGALHAPGGVSGHGAEVGVLAGLERHVELRGPALSDRGTLADLLAALVLERDVVLDRCLVQHLDHECAGGRGAPRAGEG